MRKKLLLAVMLLALLSLGYWGYGRFFGNQPAQIRATGTIEATTVNLTARINGTIQSINFQEGDHVKEGQLVAVLSRNDLAAQLERDALGVTAAEAKLQDLLNGARQQEIEEALAQVALAESSLAQAKQDQLRAQALYEAGALSQEKWEQASLNQQQRQAQLQVAQARLNLLQAGSRPAVIDAARTEIDRNRAVLKASTTLIKDLEITAPRQGTILSRNFEPGEYVAAGACIATLADLEHLWIKVYIPTDDLPRIHLGQKVTCTVSGYQQSFSGTVQHIASQGEFTPKTIQTEKERANVVFAVKINLADTKGILKPGMPADVSFIQE